MLCITQRSIFDLETDAESGCIGVSGVDECWLLMAAVAEMIPGHFGRDDR